MKMNEQIIELIQQSESQQSSSMIRTQKQEIKLYTVFFDEEIEEPSKYRDLIHLLGIAEEYDRFMFMMNSPGGYLNTTMAIIEAIKSSDATVDAAIVGDCHSGASMIALNCSRIIITDSASMMIHTAQFGSLGSTMNVKSHVDFNAKAINRLIDSTYSGFLTPSEIVSVKSGVEFWFDAKEIGKRLSNRSKHLKNKQKKTKLVPEIIETNENTDSE